jgi:hypothetical protein
MSKRSIKGINEIFILYKLTKPELYLIYGITFNYSIYNIIRLIVPMDECAWWYFTFFY